MPGKRGDEPCYLYLLGSGKNIKIGIAADMLRRIRELSAGNPGGLTPLAARIVRGDRARALEAALHRSFKPFSIGREWFTGVDYKLILAMADALIAREQPPNQAKVAALEASEADECHQRIMKMDLAA